MRVRLILRHGRLTAQPLQETNRVVEKQWNNPSLNGRYLVRWIGRNVELHIVDHFLKRFSMAAIFSRWFERGRNALESERLQSFLENGNARALLEFNSVSPAARLTLVTSHLSSGCLKWTIEVSFLILNSSSIMTMDNPSDWLFWLTEMKADVENSVRRNMTIQSKSLRCIPSDTMAGKTHRLPI